MKTLIQRLLFAVVVVGMGFWAWATFGTSGTPEKADAPTIEASVATSEPPEHVVNVTYFTSDVRCEGCREIEELTRKTVTDHYASQNAEGRVIFEMRNMDEPENAGLVEEYEISFKTVVISDHQNGERRHWTKMDDVWKLLGKPEEFTNYLSAEIERNLREET